MARIFITGSADGLGQLAAQSLVDLGHQVVLHARNTKRGKEALAKTPGAETVVTGDLGNMEETKSVAKQVNELGLFDAIIHNAGVYQASPKEIFAVNTLAPYILTCLIHKPARLIYLSSGMHLQGRLKLDSLETNTDRINYSDSKLQVLTLCLAIARKWTTVFANTIDPGWVPTKMGGRGAPDDLQKGFETQVWLAVSNDPAAKVTGQYFFHKRQAHFNQSAKDPLNQDQLVAACERITGVRLDEN